MVTSLPLIQSPCELFPPTTLTVGDSTISLFNEDCIKGMVARLEPKSVDVIVTSPPYNIGIKYFNHDDLQPRDQYLIWLGSWARAAKVVLKDEGSLFLNMGGKPSNPWAPFEVASMMRNFFQLQNVIHWVKSISIEKDGIMTVGHFKPINSDRFVNDCHEYIFHFTKNGDVKLDRLAVGVEYQDKTNIARWSGKKDRRCRGNTWLIPYPTVTSKAEKGNHPSTFPVELPERCIRLHGIERAKLVLDPFMGIGTSALAAINTGSDFVGFEIGSTYIQTLVDKL